MYSCKSFEAKTSNPNGPTPPPPFTHFWLHIICGSFQLGSSTSAFSNPFISNNISTSACQNIILYYLIRYNIYIKKTNLKYIIENSLTWVAVTPATSSTEPPFSTLLGESTRFARSFSISTIGHCNNCFPDLSNHIFLGIAFKQICNKKKELVSRPRTKILLNLS